MILVASLLNCGVLTFTRIPAVFPKLKSLPDAQRYRPGVVDLGLVKRLSAIVLDSIKTRRLIMK